MLTAWTTGDAVMAGKAYGHFWDVLMTYPEEAAQETDDTQNLQQPE